MPETLESGPDLHKRIKEDRDSYISSPEKVALYRRYADGEHDLVLTEKQKAILQGILGNLFSDNVCHQIIAESEGRLEFMRWECEDEVVSEFLGNLYITGRVADRQGEIHYDALRDGSHGVGLAWDAEKKRIKLFREPWWDGTEGLFIGYNDSDEPVYACKDRYTDDNPPKIRRTLWFDDRLERWESEDSGNSWYPSPLPEDAGAWPLPWLKKDNTPLGIPYVHFPNSGRGTGNYGVSELAGGVIGFQDQINDLQFAMSSAGRLTAYLIYYIAGIANIDGYAVGPGEIWGSTKPDTKFGSLQPGDMSQLLSLYNQKLKSVARMTRTPLHVITGEWPSGEALLRAEQPAIGKANRQAKKFTDCWTAVGHRAVTIANRFGNTAMEESPEVALISAKFGSTERRDPLSRSQIVKNLETFMSPQQAWREMGKTDKEIDQIMEERRADRQETQEDMSLGFERGTGPGTSLPGNGAPEDDDEDL